MYIDQEKPMSAYEVIHCMKKYRLPKKEMEERVCELLKKRVGVREIAAAEHLSFTEIKKIKNKYFEPEDDDSAGNSKRSKALTLMEEGKLDLYIAIELNLSSNEVEEYRQEYLKLKGEDQLLGVYRRIGGKIEPFLELYEMMDKEGLSAQEVIWAIQDYGTFENINKQFTHMTKRLRPLREEVDQLENQKQALVIEKQQLQYEIDQSVIKKGQLKYEIDQLVIRRQNEGKILQAMINVVKELQNPQDKSENAFAEQDGQLDLDWIGKVPANPEEGHGRPHRRRKRSTIRD